MCAMFIQATSVSKENETEDVQKQNMAVYVSKSVLDVNTETWHMRYIQHKVINWWI